MLKQKKPNLILQLLKFSQRKLLNILQTEIQENAEVDEVL